MTARRVHVGMSEQAYTYTFALSGVVSQYSDQGSEESPLRCSAQQPWPYGPMMTSPSAFIATAPPFSAPAPAGGASVAVAPLLECRKATPAMCIPVPSHGGGESECNRRGWLEQRPKLVVWECSRECVALLARTQC